MLARTLASAAILLLCLQIQSAVAFSHHVSPASSPPSNSNSKSEMQPSVSRRSVLATTAASLVATILPNNAIAAMDPTKNKLYTLKALSPEEAEERFREGRKSVEYLLNNYDEICEVGGDNVRRYLGTVGTSSGLFGISKAMKALGERADDIVEYTELSREVEQTIEQADGSAYMSIFVTTSTSYTPPEKYFKDAKIEIVRCAKSMDDLAAMVGIKFD